MVLLLKCEVREQRDDHYVVVGGGRPATKWLSSRSAIQLAVFTVSPLPKLYLSSTHFSGSS
jgi:hypothetical protein